MKYVVSFENTNNDGLFMLLKNMRMLKQNKKHLRVIGLRPSSSCSIASASSSDDVQPPEREVFLLEEATSFKAFRIASA